jgi:TonB family protein
VWWVLWQRPHLPILPLTKQRLSSSVCTFPDGKTDPATGIIDPLRDSRDPDPASLYPMQSRMNGEHGTAIIGYVVTTDGSVVDTTVVKSSGYPRLDEAALAQVKAWHCRPAMKNGHAIPVVMATRISFEQR